MSRSWLLLVGLFIAVAMPQPASAQALLGSSPREDQPRSKPVASATVACPGPLALACDLGGGALDAAGDVLGDVVTAPIESAGNAAMDGLTGWVGEGAAWLIGRIARLVERSTRPQLGATWFQAQYRAMLSLALLLALAFLLVAVAHAALRQDVAAAARAALVALPLAVIACFAAVTLVELALAATDEATALVTRRSGDESREFFADLADVVHPTSLATPALPGFLVLVGAVLAALLSMVVWIELILREAAIYLAVAFLPLSLAAMVWHRTAHLVRRLVEGLAAVILAKLTIAASVALAASAMGHARPGAGGMTALLGGCAVLFLAALSPWALMRLVPLAGEQVGLHRGMVKRSVGSLPGALTAATLVRSGMRTTFAAPAGPAAMGAAAATSTQQQWRPSWQSTVALRASQASSPAASRPEVPTTKSSGDPDGA